MRDILFTLPFLTDSLNVRERQHWSRRSKGNRDMAQEVMVAMGGPRHFPRPPWRHVRVTVNRCSAGRLDRDNLYGSFKPIGDALCVQSARHPHGLGIIEDDNSDRLDLVMTQSGAAAGEGYTVVRIECLDDVRGMATT